MVLERRNERYLDLLRREDQTVKRLKGVHEQHLHCLKVVRDTLKRLDVTHKVRYRVKPDEVEGIDLLITVGGDGTFLKASHFCKDIPMLGVVSSKASVGHFCGTNVETFPALMEQIARGGKVRSSTLQRLTAWVSGKPVPELILNEVLICHGNPAATSRYIMTLDDHSEEHKSSGIWIATAAGSTAAIGSAGGEILSPESKKIQFLVREPYILERENWKLKSGFLGTGDELEIASKMEKGSLFLDGSHIEYPFFMGDRIRVGPSPHPLRILGMPERASQLAREARELLKKEK